MHHFKSQINTSVAATETFKGKLQPSPHKVGSVPSSHTQQDPTQPFKQCVGCSFSPGKRWTWSPMLHFRKNVEIINSATRTTTKHDSSHWISVKDTRHRAVSSVNRERVKRGQHVRVCWVHITPVVSTSLLTSYCNEIAVEQLYQSSKQIFI